MRSDDITATTPLRAWFDRLVELPPHERQVQLDGAAVPEPLRERLREMLLFDDLVPHAPAVQDAMLAACALPPASIARVRTMLARNRQRGAERAQGVATLLRELRDEDGERAADTLLGTTIGSFRLESLLGQGGSSAVFRAVRGAGDGSQVVALKLLRTGLYSADAQRRFRREQAILAQLTHPNIATLIEGGVSAAGIPYLAMELVEGAPITQAADARRLGLEQRLVWLAGLCRTIEAAHEALIVHRDLKPSNLFVTHDGVLKVLDFGIAKAVEDEGATRTQAISLTPAYAAPEQYGTGALTTAVDVYALGVVLGELLTAQRLNAKLRASQAVAAHSGPLPAGLPPRPTLVRRLRGDLDAIVAHALADEPGMRYRSAAALGDDIERFLAGKPVRAHAPSRWYRTRKFVARHKSAVATTSLFLLALLTALAVALWQADVARREARRANTVRDFIEHMFEPIHDRVAQGKQPSLNDLLTIGLTRVDATAELGAAERVDLLTMFARLEGDLGDSRRAREIADSAVALADRSLPRTHPLAIAALAGRGYAYSQGEDYATASADLREARRLMEATGLRGQPLIDLLAPLAHLEHIEGNDEAALTLAREDMQERIATYGSDDSEVGDGYNNLADALEATERYDEAAQMWEKTYFFQLQHVGANSDKVANALAGWGSTHYRAGHWTKSRALLERAIALYEHIGNPAQLDHVWAAQKLCKVDGMLAQGAAARASCAHASELSASRFGENSALHGESLANTANGRIESGELELAREENARARALFGDAVANGSRVGNAESDRAMIELLEGDPAAARRRLPAAIRAMLSVRRYQLPPLIAQSRLLLACKESPGPECEPDLRARVERGAATAAARDNPQLLWVHTILARLEIDEGAAAAAAQRLGAAIEIARHELGATHARMIEALLWQAVAESRSGDCARAHRDAASALATARKAGALQHPFLRDVGKEVRAPGACGVLAQG